MQAEGVCLLRTRDLGTRLHYFQNHIARLTDRGHVEDRTHGVGNPAILADDPSGVLRRNLQPQDDSFPVRPFGNMHFIGIVDEGLRHELDQFFHRMLALSGSFRLCGVRRGCLGFGSLQFALHIGNACLLQQAGNGIAGLGADT